MRLTAPQVYIMRRLMHGVSKTEFWKWNQVQTRGLYMRGLFKFVRPEHNEGRYAIVTQKGWNAVQACSVPLLRKDPTRPIFRRPGVEQASRREA